MAAAMRREKRTNERTGRTYFVNVKAKGSKKDEADADTKARPAPGPVRAPRRRGDTHAK